MTALTNGEGEEEEEEDEEVAASTGAEPGLGRCRRRAEQRGPQRARAAEARQGGRPKGVLRHYPKAKPGRGALKSALPFAAPRPGAARRSPSSTVKVISFMDSRCREGG